MEKDINNTNDSETETLFTLEDNVDDDYHSKLPDLFYTKKLLFFILNMIAAGISLTLKNFVINVYLESKIENLSLCWIILFISAGNILALIFGLVFKYISMKYLKKASFFYYFNELSFFYSTFLIFSVQSLFLYRRYGSFHIKTFYGSNLEIQYVYQIILLSTFVLGVLKSLVKYVSMSFNYNMYISGIKKTLMQDVLINLMVLSKDTFLEKKDASNCEILYYPDDFVNQKPSDIPIKKSASVDENPDCFKAESPRVGLETENPLNVDVRSSFILLKEYDEEAELDFELMRVMLKEFQELYPTSLRGSLPTLMSNIKKRAKYRATKIFKNNMFNYGISNLSVYFKKECTFDYFLKCLGLKKDLKVDKVFVREFYEKHYRDMLMIQRSLEQINSAIDRIYFATKIIILFLSLVVVFINSSGQVGFVSGCISTLLGAQVVGKILSDNVIQSIIFLFIIHPFDIGDRVIININGRDENMIVAELNVFSTAFYKWDGTFYFIPNSVLITMPISNIRRSGGIMENFILQITCKTDMEKLQQLKEDLRSFCRDNPSYYTDYILVNFERIEDCNKLYIKVLMQYSKNYQNYDFHLKKRSYFVEYLNRSLLRLKIRYELPVQRVIIDKKKKIKS